MACQVGSFGADIISLLKTPCGGTGTPHQKAVPHSVVKNRDNDPDNSDPRKVPLLPQTVQEQGLCSENI